MNSVENGEVVIVRSKLLSQFRGLVFGMSTRHGGISPGPLGMNLSFSVGDDPRNVEENRSRFFGRLGIRGDRLALPKQIHSNVVKVAAAPGTFPDCDALVTNVPGIVLGVSVADCVPIVLYDPVTSSVAVVHSGWRGSKARILEYALKEMSLRYGARGKDVLAYIGPAAGACCYEVGDEVASAFQEDFVKRAPDRRPRLDLKNFNKDLLIVNGAREDNIEVSGDCTICNDSYHSFRRDGNRSGRMYGVVGIT